MSVRRCKVCRVALPPGMTGAFCSQCLKARKTIALANKGRTNRDAEERYSEIKERLIPIYAYRASRKEPLFPYPRKGECHEAD